VPMLRAVVRDQHATAATAACQRNRPDAA
jgi:hypothetical protein